MDSFDWILYNISNFLYKLHLKRLALRSVQFQNWEWESKFLISSLLWDWHFQNNIANEMQCVRPSRHLLPIKRSVRLFTAERTSHTQCKHVMRIALKIITSPVCVCLFRFSTHSSTTHCCSRAGYQFAWTNICLSISLTKLTTILTYIFSAIWK